MVPQSVPKSNYFQTSITFGNNMGISTLPIQEASLYFLERDERWKTEKPFILSYAPDPPAIKSNTVSKTRPVHIEDIRGRKDEFSYKKHRFSILDIDCPMEPEDYDDEAKVQSIYIPLVGDSLKRTLGAKRVQVYDYSVRKRNAQFPISSGGFYSHNQPSSVAHIDTTPADCNLMLQALNPREAQELEQLHYQSVNIWKPLRGPLRDWPLTLCDPSSVDPDDLQSRDTVTRTNYFETYQVYWNPAQRWYYLSDQRQDEAWIFLQADNTAEGILGVPHTSFQPTHTQSQSAPHVLRESIEVRAFVFYDD